MNIFEILLGQIPEAIFLALFMIFTKNIKTKRLLFVLLMIVEYLLLIYSFPYNWLFHILYMTVAFVTLKVLYKDKSQITDIFIFILGYIIIIATSIISVLLFGKYMIVASIVNRILIFAPLLALRYKLGSIQNVYKHYWNRNEKPKKIKSITFRCINTVVFNLLFAIINICMLIATYYNNFVK